SECSSACAFGMMSLSTNSATERRMSCWTSESPGVCASGDMSAPRFAGRCGLGGERARLWLREVVLADALPAARDHHHTLPGENGVPILVQTAGEHRDDPQAGP